MCFASIGAIFRAFFVFLMLPCSNEDKNICKSPSNSLPNDGERVLLQCLLVSLHSSPKAVDKARLWVSSAEKRTEKAQVCQIWCVPRIFWISDSWNTPGPCILGSISTKLFISVAFVLSLVSLHAEGTLGLRHLLVLSRSCPVKGPVCCVCLKPYFQPFFSLAANWL